MEEDGREFDPEGKVSWAKAVNPEDDLLCRGHAGLRIDMARGRGAPEEVLDSGRWRDGGGEAGGGSSSHGTTMLSDKP